MSRESQQDKFRDAAKEVGLTKDEARRMHDDLQKEPDKEDLTYRELVDRAQEYKSK